MAIDIHGNLITQEQAEGLKRFNENNAPVKLCFDPNSVLTFEIDADFAHEFEEDANIYWDILPTQIYNNVSFVPSVGERITFSKQYTDGGPTSKNIIKRFEVTKIEKQIIQDTTRLSLFVTVYVMPD